MSDIEAKIKVVTRDAVENEFNFRPDEELLMVEAPRDTNMGDYATNIAMRLAKTLKMNPEIIANKLVEAMKPELPEMESITVARPGFINFKMKEAALANKINEILESGDDYGHNTSGNGLRILVEYVSANPTGDLHCGHARGAAWGDCITRLLSASGYDCLREFYINDAGHQIDMLGESLISRYFEHFGKEYPLPEEGYHAQDVIDIANNLAEKEGDKWLTADPTERLEYFKDEGIELELKKIEDDLKLYRVEFDSWVHERFFYKDNSIRIKQVLDKMKAMNLTYEQDGALWFRSTEYGDDKDRVLVKKDGSLTYLTPDIANHVYKLERGYTKLVNLWGADHHSYITRMTACLEALGYPKGTLEVDLIQMVRMVEDGKEVKMSKRTGNAITLRELCEDVGIDAARWFFVSKDVGTHMDFDLKLARTKTNENPVYYVQYAYTRMSSILKGTAKHPAPEFKKEASYDLLTDPKEMVILKQLGEFPGIVADAAKTRMPNKICNYLQALAKNFHNYYVTNKVNDPEKPELTNQRLGLIHASMITMKNALHLIGVSAPEKM